MSGAGGVSGSDACVSRRGRPLVLHFQVQYCLLERSWMGMSGAWAEGCMKQLTGVGLPAVSRHRTCACCFDPACAAPGGGAVRVQLSGVVGTQHRALDAQHIMLVGMDGGSLHLDVKYLAVVWLASWMMCSGMGPSTASIMARCSRFSCVWNSASPASRQPLSSSFPGRHRHDVAASWRVLTELLTVSLWWIHSQHQALCQHAHVAWWPGSVRRQLPAMRS